MTSPVFSTLESSRGLFSLEKSVKGETINKTDNASTSTQCLDKSPRDRESQEGLSLVLRWGVKGCGVIRHHNRGHLEVCSLST